MSNKRLISFGWSDETKSKTVFTGHPSSSSKTGSRSTGSPCCRRIKTIRAGPTEPQNQESVPWTLAVVCGELQQGGRGTEQQLTADSGQTGEAAQDGPEEMRRDQPSAGVQNHQNQRASAGPTLGPVWPWNTWSRRTESRRRTVSLWPPGSTGSLQGEPCRGQRSVWRSPSSWAPWSSGGSERPRTWKLFRNQNCCCLLLEELNNAALWSSFWLWRPKLSSNEV